MISSTAFNRARILQSFSQPGIMSIKQVDKNIFSLKRKVFSNFHLRCFSKNTFLSAPKKEEKGDIWTNEKVNAYVGHSFPDFIDFWNRKVYRQFGYGELELFGRFLRCNVLDLKTEIY